MVESNEDILKICEIFAFKQRFAILRTIWKDGELNFRALQGACHVSGKSLQRHLKILIGKMRILGERKEKGQRIIYFKDGTLFSSRVNDLLTYIDQSPVSLLTWLREESTTQADPESLSQADPESLSQADPEAESGERVTQQGLARYPLLLYHNSTSSFSRRTRSFSICIR